MKDKIISTRTAKLAMEVGFNLNIGTGWFYKSSYGEIWTNNKGGIDGKLKTYTKPSQSLLQKWIREKHKIHCQSVLYGDGKHYWPSLIDIENEPIKRYNERLSYKYYHQKNGVITTTYEKALEIALYDALLIIKKK